MLFNYILVEIKRVNEKLGDWPLLVYLKSVKQVSLFEN